MQSNLTREQAIEFFRLKDSDNNGYLDVKEVRELYRDICRRHRVHFDEKHVLAFIKKVDTNRDHKIDRDEFLAIFFPPRVPPNIKNDLRTHCFKLLDSNFSGFIERNELIKYFKDIGKRNNVQYTQHQLEAIFRFEKNIYYLSLILN
jgi:Ca2+-binding EF-hand superfamily protein